MIVWLLYDYCDRVEGVYSDTGKIAKEKQLLATAVTEREKANALINQEIIELKELRQPYLTEADMLLDTERAMKETNNVSSLKSIRKQRKTLLRQADQLTYRIRNCEERILASQRMTKSELLDTFCRGYYWSEYSLEDC